MFKLLQKMTLGLLCLGLTLPAFGLPRVDTSAKPTLAEQDQRILLARKKKKRKRGAREKHMIREKTVRSKKGKDRTNVDFEEAAITGDRKAPISTLINQNKADKNYDFVKIREKWHPEMIQSASSLDAGSR